MQMDDRIRVGDAVYLAGSPNHRMTVTEIFDDGEATVVWFDKEGHQQIAVYACAALVRVDP